MKRSFQDYLFTLAVLTSVVRPILSLPPSNYSWGLEKALRTELFENANYSAFQRPVKKVDVKVALTLLTVNELNVRDQILSVSGYLSISWDDWRLSWSNTSATSQDYSNIDSLFSTEVNVWTPALIIENSIHDMSVISDIKIPMRIKSDGKIFWSPSGVYRVSCESDITYYPLDRQTCFIKISTWGYTKSEITLFMDENTPVDTTFYSENGEWDFLSSAGHTPSSQVRGGTWYSTLSFSITLRRKPVYHALNTLFPVILMTFLIPMVYKLPTESGEKMSYSLTVLLAYAVYLSLISDNIPSTSKSVCLLSLYLGVTLAFSTVSVNIVIFIIYAYFQEEKKAPYWANRIYKKIQTMRAKKKCDADVNKVVPSIKGEKNDTDVLGIVSESEQNNNEMNTLTYRRLSEILDHLFFVVYLTATILITIVFLVSIIINFYSSD
ncbi:neuronal acetylcholine receptor subunit alpha-6 [Magallana gigas]|uniref:Neuronal acetylcholine receptor subunit alpha-6 n=1 Tax=Magallana gigas TaxID=29159 RepID=A0A8W8NNZ2_MAGGI|nr:neuronal acetylcholine receptor subunit alpha-6 [Crassostrea gigas]